ncbi:MAG: hypothetical protein L6265_00145 [Thermoplasmatales archaeon]|nr:hypothetical protein [Thermoplasmatales archaeon]
MHNIILVGMRKIRFAMIVALVALIVLLSAIFPMFMKIHPPVMKVSAESSLTLKASPKSASIIVDDETLRTRRDGYAVYNLTVQSTVDVDYIDFEATNSSEWAVNFLNLSGVPLPNSRINNVIASTDYYVYAKVKVPASTNNGTSLTHTIYANASDGNTSSVDVKTTCELFGVEAVPAGPTEPHAIMGTVNHTNGSVADGAFVLLINMATGETSYDTVGTNGASGISGNYSTDTSQFPKGFTNGDKLKIIANDGTDYGVKTLTADNNTQVQWANITLDITGGVVPPDEPSGTTLGNSTGTVRVSWSAPVSGADTYTVYKSSDRFAAFPGGWAANTGVATLYWDDAANTYTDVNTYYYVVRAVKSSLEGGNGTMTVKVSKTFSYNSGVTNVNWLSLPYNCSYKLASDIVTDVEGGTGSGFNTKIKAVYKWNATTQSVTQSYIYKTKPAGWDAAGDFVISPGDGIGLELSGVGFTTFSWVVVGADVNSTQKFVYNSGVTNVNWLSIPYTSVYKKASDVVLGIEGGTGSGFNTKIKAVYKWNATTQSVTQSYIYKTKPAGWDAAGDFDISPGDGIGLELSGVGFVVFTWDTLLVTPAVPDNPYVES